MKYIIIATLALIVTIGTAFEAKAAQPDAEIEALKAEIAQIEAENKAAKADQTRQRKLNRLLERRAAALLTAGKIKLAHVEPIRVE